ncbi:MAG TPA: hypothetical protein VK900_14025 [Anaerolineales bacterium]|nr:hypothetical protein [Anaerolineales bacterium]
MKHIRTLTFIGGLVLMALAFGFIFRVPLALNIWPWEDGRYSYLFVGSILAAVSAAALWIGWSGELGALPAGSLNIFVIALTSSIYFFKLGLADGRTNLIPFGIASIVMALASAIAFWWSRRIPLRESQPTPWLVKASFVIFIVLLLLAGGALVLHEPVFPWNLNPDSSVIFGCILIGDAFYFLYGLLYPGWKNAIGQLLSFLAYDLVLIVPFLSLFNTVPPERVFNLFVYVAVLVYSGALAIYFLFIQPQTRLGRQPATRLL